MEANDFTFTSLLGLWTCHQYIGDIAAALASGYLLYAGYDWRWCIVLPAVINGIWSFVNFYLVPNTPEEFGLALSCKRPTSVFYF